MSKESNYTDLLARWINDELSAEDKRQFEQEDEFQELKTVVEDIDSWKISPLDINTSYSTLQEKKRLKKKAKVVPMTTWYRVAASVVLLTVAYLGWDYFLNTNVLIQTNIGEKKEIVLPDGSKVTLDAASSIAYKKRNWEEDRNVEIVGQAYLDVEPGESFIVSTEKGTVSVLGTQFNVKVAGPIFEVKCYEGKVQVRSVNQAEILVENEGVKLVSNELQRFRVEAESDWVRGFSSYTRTPLSEVVSDLTKYYKLEINLPDKFSDLLFTGQFSHSNQDQALRAVFSTMEIRYRVTDGKVDFE